MRIKRPYKITNRIVSGNNWAEIERVRRGFWLVRVHNRHTTYVNTPPHPSNRADAFDLAVRLLEGEPE